MVYELAISSKSVDTNRLRTDLELSPAVKKFGLIWLHGYYSSSLKRLMKIRLRREKLSVANESRKKNWWLKLCGGKSDLLRCRQTESRARAHWFYREVEGYSAAELEESTVFLMQKEITGYWHRQYAYTSALTEGENVIPISEYEDVYETVMRQDRSEKIACS